MDDLAKKVLSIEMDGLTWGKDYKLEPVAFGIKKLVVVCTILDDLVSTDDLQGKIEAFEDFVQSVDIQAFNKIWEKNPYISLNIFKNNNINNVLCICY